MRHELNKDDDDDDDDDYHYYQFTTAISKTKIL